MGKNESHIQEIQSEDDFKKVASFSDRKKLAKQYIPGYTGTTKENATLLRNPEFKKAYLEKFTHIRNESRNARMNLVKDRPHNNAQIQEVRKSVFSKMGESLREILSGSVKSVQSIEGRLTSGRDSLKAYSGKLVRQFNSVKITGYFPPPKGGYRSKKEAQMEGGANDKIGKPLYTLQQYLQGKAPYVSIAGHKSISYGTRVRIASLEAQCGRPIECRVVDTGGAFNKKPPYAKLDVCVQDGKSSGMASVNTHTSVQQIA